MDPTLRLTACRRPRRDHRRDNEACAVRRNHRGCAVRAWEQVAARLPKGSGKPFTLDITDHELAHDPLHVTLAFWSIDHTTHVRAVGKATALLGDARAVRAMRRAGSPEAALGVLRAVPPSAAEDRG